MFLEQNKYRHPGEAQWAFLCFHKTGFTFSWVEFRSANAYAKASNLLLHITASTGMWELHTFKDFNMAKPTEDPFPTRSCWSPRSCPAALKNLITGKEFFNKFGEVQFRANVPLVRAVPPLPWPPV